VAKICRWYWYWWQFTTSVVDTGGKFVRERYRKSGCGADRGRMGDASSKERDKFVVSIHYSCYESQIMYSTAWHNIFYNVYQGRKLNKNK
jgi:hypothetical protein